MENTMIIRFYAIDAPEVGQDGSIEATEFVKERLLLGGGRKRKDLSSKSSPPRSSPPRSSSSTSSSSSSSSISKPTKGRIVKLKLLRIDQYNRAVCKLTTRYSYKSRFIPLLFSRDDIAYDLAKSGHATLYDGGGREYDGRKDEFVAVIRKALDRKRRKFGGKIGVEEEEVSPAEFKRRKRQKGKGVEMKERTKL